ncbi:Spy/CpxP family protein refolding chaperone, partial [Ferrovibrio sp.]|uniref:Spy/CpxP family protein refolding chaperone n=1 Tax=Ferrovibrio sp. TaxID=1917215 RepID=UPI00261E8274
MSVRNLLIAASVIATGFAGGLVLAQPNTQPGPMGPGSMGPGSMGSGPHMQMQADQAGPGRFIEGRIAFLRTELKLTATQQPLFDTLANEMRASATAMQARFEAHRQQASAQSPATLSVIERMEQRQAMMKDAVAAQERYLAA